MDPKMISKSKEDVIDLSIDDDEDIYVITGDSDGVAVISLDDSDEISEWDAEIRKNFSQIISDELVDESVLLNFMLRYLGEVEYMCGCYEDSEDLRRKVQNHVEFLHSSFRELTCRTEEHYLEIMEDILTEYMKLELNVTRKMVKVINKRTANQIKATAQRIVRILAVILLNQNKHMLHVLIKQNDNYDGSESCCEVLNLIYEHYLIAQLPADKSDETFCRRYIIFQKWKNFFKRSSTAEMDRVMYKQHNRRPESIETNDILRPILMPSGESTVDIVRLCYDGLYQITQRYFKYLNCKKERVCDTEFDVDLSNFVFQDDEVAAVSDHNSEDMELSKACENFLTGLSLGVKASASTNYDKNQRYKEESLEVEEDEEVSPFSLDKDVFMLENMNISLPSVGNVGNEAATISKDTHPEHAVSDEAHTESSVSEETPSESTVSDETHPEPAVSEKRHSEPAVSEKRHSKQQTVPEETRPEPAVATEVYLKSIVPVEAHLESTVSKEINAEPTVPEEAQSEFTVSVVPVQEGAEVSVVSTRVPVPTDTEDTSAAGTSVSTENEMNQTNVEVMDMELCSELVPEEEIVEQHEFSDDADMACPELTPEVSCSATCPELIPEVLSSKSNLRAPTLSSVKNYSYNYGQITPPSDVSSDDHIGDKVVVYPKPVQPSRTKFCASQVNGVHHRTEMPTRECVDTLSKQIAAEVLPHRVSSFQSHSVINSANKREHVHRTKNIRGRDTVSFIAPAAAKVQPENVTDNLNVELNKTIDTGQVRVVPVNTMQSTGACHSSVKIKENTFSLEGFTRFEQLQNEIMNGPVSKVSPVKPALTADERRDLERDIFNSKVTLVQRPLQVPPPISGDESSRSNSPSDSPSPAYEVIEKDDCKDHFAHSFKDANGANGSRALVQRVNRDRAPKSILKKSKSATPRKKKSDHIKFNEYASISFFNANPGVDNSHTKYLQQVLRKEDAVLPSDMPSSVMEDPKLNEQPKVVLKTHIKNKINDYVKSDYFVSRCGTVTQPNISGCGTIRVDFDKSNGNAKLNNKDVVYKTAIPSVDIEKTVGFRKMKSGCWVMYLKNQDYLDKKPNKRKMDPPNHITGDSVPAEKRKRVCRTPEEKLDDGTMIQKRKGRRPKTPRTFSIVSPNDNGGDVEGDGNGSNFDKLLSSGAYTNKPFRLELI